MISRGYKTLVFPGDVFHVPQQPISYLNSVIDQLHKFKMSGIEIYSIQGNHDCTYNKYDYLSKSALGLMFKTGLIKELRVEKFVSKDGYGINLYGYHYEEPLKPVISLNSEARINVAVCHRFYENSFDKGSLTSEIVDNLGYNILVAGW